MGKFPEIARRLPTLGRNAGDFDLKILENVLETALVSQLCLL
jgi:hypothetical protein